MFKENWSMKYDDWAESDGADIEEAGRQTTNDPIKKNPDPKDKFPAIGEAPTMTMSDDGESHAESTDGGSKLSTKVMVVRWYNNRGRIQKALMVIGILVLLVILLAVVIWAATKKEESPTYKSSAASETISDRDFDVPIVLSTSSPTMSPTAAPNSHNNIMDNTPTEPPAQSISTPLPTDTPRETPYSPGLLNTLKHGLLLSEGLDARIVAVAGEKVVYEKKKKDHNSKDESNDEFLSFPDAGATFESRDGGWIYVSNSEAPNNEGGVGALTFDKHGNVKKYEVLLKGTNLNKGGGKTPFGTWVSCEENGTDGHIYQVDPTGKLDPEEMTIGREGGNWESFGYDIRDEENPRFFVTEDAIDGALQRFTPEKTDWRKPWKMLHMEGTIEYLILFPNADNNGGHFFWTDNREEARANAELHYPNTEGLDVYESKMYFVCKTLKELFVLDLDAGTYSKSTTAVGLFDGAPDQVHRAEGVSQELLYFTEDNASNVNSGVHARDHEGKFYTILESEIFDDETTGLSFSPDGLFMYIAYQSSGLLFAVWRTDGQSFHDTEQLSINYHNS